MTDHLPDVANQNASLLRAIAGGGHDSLAALAQAAEVRADNLNRKLKLLEGEGLIAKTGEASWQVELTAAGERALLAIRVFTGEVEVGAAERPHRDLPPALIDPNPWQPRKVPDPRADAEMVESVADKGVLQRILVRPHPAEPGRFQQALGHRRVHAARVLGVAVPVEIRELSDDDMAEIGVIENVQRADLHWMDEAEGYLMLAERGRSAAQIVRLVGEGGRKKRSVQELIQFARELAPELKDRCRLPEGDPERLSVDQARALVGNKRPRPSIDLTPKLACALLELLLAADCAGGEEGDVMEAPLQKRPTGGALITLSDRGLIRFRFAAGQPVATIPVTAELARYLHETGYNDEPVDAVRKARAAVVGELAAGALEAENRWLTVELNAPEPPPANPSAPTVAGFCKICGSMGQLTAMRCEACRDAPDPQSEDEDEEAAASQPAAEAAKLAELDDDETLALMELAHKVAVEADPTDPLGAVTIDASYRNDAMSNRLIYARMLMIKMIGPTTAAALTPTAREWLVAKGAPVDDQGRPTIGDETLAYAQARHGGRLVGRYVTPWLTVLPAHAVRDAAETPPPTASTPAAFAPGADTFMDLVRETAQAEGEPAADAVAVDGAAGRAPEGLSAAAVPTLDETTARRLIAAAREAGELLGKARSRKLKPAEIDAACALLDGAIGDAERWLSKDPAP